MLNVRHKTIVFVTILLTGTALLGGATLRQAFGVLLLGGAAAWMIGSKAVADAFTALRQLQQRSRPVTFELASMFLGGLVLVALSLASRYNSFIVLAGMALFWLVTAKLSAPIQTPMRKILFWVVAVAVAFLGSVTGMMINRDAGSHGERLGEFFAWAMIALPFSRYWLTKGVRLVSESLTAPGLPEGDALVIPPVWRRAMLYVVFGAGVAMLALSLAVLAFGATTEAIYPLPALASTTSAKNPMGPVLLLMLLSWWPFAAWRRILKDEPNAGGRFIRRHQVVMVATLGVVGLMTSVAVVFGYQNGDDRRTAADLTEQNDRVRTFAAKIGELKSRDFQTTQDYIDAYTAMEPLLNDLDAALDAVNRTLARAEERDTMWTPVDFHRVRTSEKAWRGWTNDLFGLLHEDSQLTRLQIGKIREMSALPAEGQVDYWTEEVKPLLEREEAIREKLRTTMAAKPAS